MIKIFFLLSFALPLTSFARGRFVGADLQEAIKLSRNIENDIDRNSVFSSTDTLVCLQMGDLSGYMSSLLSNGYEELSQDENLAKRIHDRITALKQQLTLSKGACGVHVSVLTPSGISPEPAKKGDFGFVRKTVHEVYLSLQNIKDALNASSGF